MTTTPTRDRIVFDESRQRQLKELFERLDDEVRYVIPRGYDDLLRSVRGGDLDVFVEADGFPKAVEIANAVGFESRRSLSDPVRLLTDAVRKPVTAFRMAISEPDEVYRLVAGSLSSGRPTPGRRGYAEARLHDDDLQLHLFNHLAYTSTLDERKIRSHPEVEEHMLRHRIRTDPWAVPHRVDAFLHLLCRGIFDYGGEFPDYYVEKCRTLFADIRDTPEDDDRLQYLLDLVFFDAASLVYDLATEGRYDDMRGELRTFTEY